MIYVLGGGSGKLFAVISVTYPAGSICTCTKGSKVLKAKDTSGKALFNVPEAGEWLVECQTEDGSKKKSQIVKISEASESFAVVLTYELVLFENGTYAPETGGWANSKGGSPIENKLLKSSSSCFNHTGTGSVEDSSNVYTKKEIDLSAYSTLVFTIERCPSEEGNTEVRAGGAKARVQNGKYTSGGELSLDISEISTAKVEIYSSTFSVSGGKTQTVLFKKIVCR